MKFPARRDLLAKLALFGGVLAVGATRQAEAAPKKSSSKRFIKNDLAQSRSYSQAVVTRGGTTIWLAGQTGSTDDAGKPIPDFEGQVRQTFKLLGQTLELAGGKLGDMVTMTVFVTDIKNQKRFLELRTEIFGDNFPASAFINIVALATPTTLLEIQGYAVVA